MARRLVARESGEWESMMMMKIKDGEEEKRSTAVVTKKRGYDITRNPYLNKVHTHTSGNFSSRFREVSRRELSSRCRLRRWLQTGAIIRVKGTVHRIPLPFGTPLHPPPRALVWVCVRNLRNFLIEIKTEVSQKRADGGVVYRVFLWIWNKWLIKQRIQKEFLLLKYSHSQETFDQKIFKVDLFLLYNGCLD